MTLTFFTIGHSDRGMQELMELLRLGEFAEVIDIRIFPGSRINPDYNEDILLDLPPRSLGHCESPGLVADLPAPAAGFSRTASGVSPPCAECGRTWL